VFGFLNINKPPHVTSRGAVNTIQKLIKPTRVGHAGTLDPLATGVLVLCVGPATRLTRFIQDQPKVYLADFELGVVSDTEDRYGEKQVVPFAPEISAEDLAAVLPSFTGEILQRPPAFSALKIQGKRAYSLARQGKDVQLTPRKIQIHDLQLVDFAYPKFQLRIHCGSGTYVRSLGRDIGEKLGSGAIMTGLSRVSIGDFDLANAFNLDDLTKTNLEEHLVSPAAPLEQLESVQIPEEQIQRFANGHTWSFDTPRPWEMVKAVDPAGRLVAILQRKTDTLFTPSINFAHYWVEQGLN
jgi:tRNA pseudouridine55 synthase